jgi:hypothetical protein
VRDGARRDRVLEDEVPSDDPCEQLAEGRVRVRVGAAGDRHHGRELGIAEPGERAREPGDDEGQDEPGPRELVRRQPGQHEDAGADDGADAERGQADGSEDAAELMLPGELGQQHLDALGPKERVHPPHLLVADAQCSRSCPSRSGAPPVVASASSVA